MADIYTDRARITLVHHVEGNTNPVLNTFGTRCTPGDTPLDVAIAWQLAWVTNIMPVVCEDLICDSVEILTFDDRVATFGVGVPGSNTSPCAPPQVCSRHRKQTGMAGSGNSGRIYLAGVPESAVDAAGQIDSSLVDDYQDAMNSFWSDIDDGYSMYVLHRDSALAPTYVTNIVSESIVATQRRRLR